jgi:plastocyanin
MFGLLLALLLPARLVAPAPFPAIVAQAPTISSVAPGVEQGDYELLTPDGPIAVHVVAIAPHRKDLHLAAVLATDHLTSPGETVLSMARRTGAVAAINGDYFDIDNTNQPTNVLIRNGRLLRTPRRRYAIAIDTDGTPRFAEFSFTGTVMVGTNSVALDAVNEYPPPQGGTSLLTPEFGTVAPQANLTLVSLAPLDGVPPLSRYRVSAIADNGSAQPPGYYLAIGLAAYASAGVPNEGDVVSASGDFDSGDLSQIATAVGGGPLLLHAGAYYDDPDGPDRNHYITSRIPASGAAIAPDGTLFLIEVDGRQPAISIGVTRPQFAALMRAFGATEGMSLDGGGSSTLVARDLGDASASLQNVPSDGHERPVSDGLFVYSDAPVGPPALIVARPSAIRAMPGASIPLETAIVDVAGHRVASADGIRATVEPAGLGTYTNGAFVANAAGDGRLVLKRGALGGTVAIHVVGRPARLEIVPDAPNVDPGDRIQFVVRAFDADGFSIALPAKLRWSANSGTIDGSGRFVAANGDATITVNAGDAVAYEHATVGRHEEPLSVGSHATFVSSPTGGPGNLAVGSPCPTCLAISYDFTGTEIAAYASLKTPLPSGAVGVAFDVNGDSSGAIVRVVMLNAIDEKFYLTATPLNFTGWHHVVVRLPSGFAGPGRLGSIYVINGLGSNHIKTAGTIAVRDVRSVLPGSGPVPGSPTRQR